MAKYKYVPEYEGWSKQMTTHNIDNRDIALRDTIAKETHRYSELLKFDSDLNIVWEVRRHQKTKKITQFYVYTDFPKWGLDKLPSPYKNCAEALAAGITVEWR